jgi:ribosomal protein S18 acetylase RimI-like enzyme
MTLAGRSREIAIRPARTDTDLAEIRRLFQTYADWLKVDLCFQGFEDELAGLPGKYSEPEGGLWLGWAGSSAVACVGLRPLEQGNCEMKRLWVEPGYRRTGLGRKLAVLTIDAARKAGHKRMVLDTFEWLTEAIAMYRDLGFREIEAYYHNPESNVCYMAKDL